jgi:hypothetical protein
MVESFELLVVPHQRVVIKGLLQGPEILVSV